MFSIVGIDTCLTWDNNTFELAPNPTSNLMGKYRDIPTNVRNKMTRVPTVSTVTKHCTGAASLCSLFNDLNYLVSTYSVPSSVSSAGDKEQSNKNLWTYGIYNLGPRECFR